MFLQTNSFVASHGDYRNYVWSVDGWQGTPVPCQLGRTLEGRPVKGLGLLHCSRAVLPQGLALGLVSFEAVMPLAISVLLQGSSCGPSFQSTPRDLLGTSHTPGEMWLPGLLGHCTLLLATPGLPAPAAPPA